MKFYEDGQVLTVQQVEADWGFSDMDGRWRGFKSLLRDGGELRWRMVVKGPRSARFGFVIVRPGPSLGQPEATEHIAHQYLVGMA